MHVFSDETGRQEAQDSLKQADFIRGEVLYYTLEPLNAKNASEGRESLYFASPDMAENTRRGRTGYLANVPSNPRLVFFPLNVDDGHWVSLVYDRRTEKPSFHLYDSFGKNERDTAVAMDLAENVLEQLPHGSRGFDFVRHEMPLQKGNDCAVNVLALGKMFQAQAEAGAISLGDITEEAFQPYLNQMSRENLSSYLSSADPAKNPALRPVPTREILSQHAPHRTAEVPTNDSDYAVALALHHELNGDVSTQAVWDMVTHTSTKSQTTPETALRDLPAGNYTFLSLKRPMNSETFCNLHCDEDNKMYAIPRRLLSPPPSVLQKGDAFQCYQNDDGPEFTYQGRAPTSHKGIPLKMQTGDFSQPALPSTSHPEQTAKNRPVR